ncbi:MAG: DUF1501 domain-containing protein [Planctomycetota bacterium]|nr:MAG: DUF1501 domain-containing protein [Planctomycetota bacterium]
MARKAPGSMTRRHFLNHLATASATLPTLEFIAHVQAHAADLKKRQKACILMWMGGGPPTIDIWDLKPGSKNGGEFKPIPTKVPGIQICEHMPKTAMVMDKLSLVRSMSTREADHGRGRYFMHTAFRPNPTVVHPTFGSVVSFELGRKRPELEIPAFISVNAPSGSPGFLGAAHAPFVVDSNGRIRNAQLAGDRNRLMRRLEMLTVIEKNFINSNRGELPLAHRDIYKKAVNLMVSKQMEAFRVDKEDPKTIEMYGNNNFGRGLLMARRLVEVGVPFIEVGMGGWDLHQNVFNTLRDQRLPILDQGIAALVQDLTDRGMIDDVVLVWMGEFGRTPRINQNVGRDHWAASWTVMIGGGGLNNGQAIGATDKDGVACTTQTYLPGDIWATVAHALGIPTTTVHTSKRGRPMKLANGGTPIKELIG